MSNFDEILETETPCLPEILPLIGNGPRPPLNKSKRNECGCDICQHWIPLVRHLESKLDSEGKVLLKELVDDWESACFDRDIAQAKLSEVKITKSNKL